MAMTNTIYCIRTLYSVQISTIQYNWKFNSVQEKKGWIPAHPNLWKGNFKICNMAQQKWYFIREKSTPKFVKGISQNMEIL